MDRSEFFQNIPRDVVERAIREKGTPSYLYFMKIIEKKFGELRSCLPASFKIHYAIKANPNQEIVKKMNEMGVGADVSSLGELKIALNCGIGGDRIEFSGPGKKEEEIGFAVRSAISSINAESISELEKIRKICKAIGLTANVGIRINSNPGKLSAGLTMSGDSQFGLQEECVGKALEFIKENSEVLKFSGIHVHSGSQILSEEGIIDNFRDILDLAVKIDNYDIRKIKKINFGGGWGIKYFPNQKSLDLKKVAEGLGEFLNNPKYKKVLDGIRLILEPGRFLVGECGVYATRVLYCKRGLRKNFLIVDGGMHQHYLLAGGMGQVIRRNFEVDVLYMNDRQPTKSQKYDIAGCLCTPQDILAVNFETDREVIEGDYILFLNSGAYGFSASPVHFLNHPLPSEMVL